MTGRSELTMIINATDFLYGGELFYKNLGTGRCYRLYVPPAFFCEGNGNKVLTAEPVRPDIYDEYLDNCREVAMKWGSRYA
jgi:hypothetical protein